MQQPSDEELVAEDRINELFERYQRLVAAWCLRFTGDRDSAGDLAQDIFLKAYRNINLFRGDAKFSTWLFSIARNHCMNELKARAARPEYPTDGCVLDLQQSGDDDALASLEKDQSMEAMRAFVRQNLDPIEQQVMNLHYSEEISLEVITRLLGLTNASGARAYIMSAKRKLGAAAQRWKLRQ